MKKIISILLAFLLVVGFLPVTYAEEVSASRMADNAYSIDFVEAIFPEAELRTRTWEQSTDNRASGNRTSIPKASVPSEKPVETYTRNDETGSHCLDVYSDGSYNIYGVLAPDSFINEYGDYVNSTPTRGVGIDDSDGSGGTPDNGYTLFENYRAYWSAGNGTSFAYQYMQFNFDFRKLLDGVLPDPGYIVDGYNAKTNRGTGYTALGYWFQHVSLTKASGSTPQYITQTAQLCDDTLELIETYKLKVTISTMQTHPTASISIY